MKIVVTGGGGFIGSHLCERLLAEGEHVICLDNFLTGRPENVAHITDPRFELRRHDITTPVDIRGPVDFVLHFASAASPVDYMAHPIQTLKAGALGTWITLGLARAKGARLVLASTSEVYGDPEITPQSETYWGHVNPIGPRGCYDEAKRFAEAMTMAYHRFHGVNTGIIRVFNTYGPRLRPDDGRVIPTLATQAIRGEPLTIHGDGGQTRSFCYVTDLIDGVVRLMRSDVHEPVNLGNPEEIRVIDLARLILEITGSRSALVHRPRPEDDPTRRCPDISRACSLLGWEPRVALRDGLTQTLDWFRAHRVAAVPGFEGGSPPVVGAS
jgi:dTDP-glucose 4,6-dehydratase